MPKCKVNKKSTRGHPSIRGHPNIRGCPGRKGMPSGDALWGCPTQVLVDSRARTGTSDVVGAGSYKVPDGWMDGSESI